MGRNGCGLQRLLESVIGKFLFLDCVVVGGLLKLAFESLDLLLVLLAQRLQFVLVELGLLDLGVEPLFQVAELVVLRPQLCVQTLVF